MPCLDAGHHHQHHTAVINEPQTTTGQTPHYRFLQRPVSAGTVIRESTTPQLKPPTPHQLRTSRNHKSAPQPPAPQPAPLAAPKKRRVREHHEECDEELYEGGNCTCWSIKRFGPPSERDNL